jgi:hypothetical protein
MIGEKCRRDAMWLGKRTLVVSMLIKHPVYVTLTILFMIMLCMMT